MPVAQVSPEVQATPSSHVPVNAVYLQPALRSQTCVVHWLPSKQRESVGAPAHLPAVHASLMVQSTLSLQLAVLLRWLQPTPTVHRSLVQALPSSHELALGAPAHTPAAHTSLLVHPTPSLQELELLACWQPAVLLQVSSVHGLLSPHNVLLAVPPHLPAKHTSLVVQATPSSQLTVLLACTQAPPVQLSVVHTLLSLQSEATRHSTHLLSDALQLRPVVQVLPPVQVPVAQLSPVVQLTASLQLPV